MDCRAKPGNDEIKMRSRDALAPHSLSPPGFDPVVHAEVQRIKRHGRTNEPPLCMDCRVKPGNDEIKMRSRDAPAPEFC